jgi:hypothetical protein
MTLTRGTATARDVGASQGNCAMREELNPKWPRFCGTLEMTKLWKWATVSGPHVHWRGGKVAALGKVRRGTLGLGKTASSCAGLTSLWRWWNCMDWVHSHTHSHTLTHMHTCTHSHTHLHTLTRMHTCTHSHACTVARTHTLTRVHSCTHSHTLTHVHTCTHPLAHTHMHVHLHALTRIHTCTHSQCTRAHLYN